MPGLIALVGGNEFRTECRPMDQKILARLGAKPRVVILPTAAAHENPGLAAGNGILHFRLLGARADAAMVVDSATAADPRWLGLIQNADLVYFAGGDPLYLLRTLRHSPTWKTALEVWKSGRILAGSSAGAMILGGQMWGPGQGWLEGLGLVPGFAILPHHGRLAESWNVEEMRSSLPPGVTLIGIDEATGLLGPPWEVIGAERIAVYSRDTPQFFTQGQFLEEE